MASEFVEPTESVAPAEAAIEAEATPTDHAEHTEHPPGEDHSLVEPAEDCDERLGPHISADAFKTLFRYHPAGVCVITANGSNGPVALTATSVSSISAEPPLLVFSVSALSSSSPTLAEAETVVVHFLDDADLPVAVLGATHGVDRFADTTAWRRLPTGEPVYHGVRAWVRCAVIDRMDAGASTVYIAQALESEAVDDPANGALVFHNRTWHRLSDASVITT